jgi:hypothetical protein
MPNTRLQNPELRLLLVLNVSPIAKTKTARGELGMLRYSSRRHKKLMDESEYALRNAAVSASQPVVRIVNAILHDHRAYGLWESRHADLLLPIAAQSDKTYQILALRSAEVHLVHRRALFAYLQEKELRGERRRLLFRIFHSTLDYHAAVLAEHRQYMLAVSSHVSADHLVDVMHDPKSKRLLRQYEDLYARYFDMKCYVAGTGDSNCIELVRSGMGDARQQLRRVRQRIASEPPVSSCGDFDRQEALARSGRYPALNYMVG